MEMTEDKARDEQKNAKEEEKKFLRIVIILAFALLVAATMYSIGEKAGYLEKMNEYYEEHERGGCL